MSHPPPIDSATQAKFMYLFERISEPIYFGPRGQGKNRVLYVTPLDRLPPNIAKAVVELRKGIPPDSVKTIDVSYSSVPYDLTHVKLIPKDAIFTPLCQFHLNAAAALLKIFSEQKSLSDFFSAACMCRDEINSHLWVYTLSRAIILRPDMKGFKLPAICEIMPDRFLNGNILREARRQARLPESTRAVIVVDRSFSGLDLNPENKVAYWREDIALNTAHWIWHVVYAINSPAGQRDRKGELFFKMHHDMVARYDAERLANGLSRVVPVDILGTADEGYFPKLTLENSALQFGTRQPNTTLKNVNRVLDTSNPWVISLNDMKVWMDRILEAIDQQVAITPTGQTIPLGNEKGIDILGAMLEASSLSPNPGFYGDVHNTGHNVLAYCVDPDFRYKENGGVMMATETAVRDPIFFRWHRVIDDIFLRHKSTLPAYDQETLVWPGITVANFSVQTEDRTPSTLVTFLEQRDVDLSRGLDFGRGTFNNFGPMLARVTHLQHEEFKYRLEVNNSTQRSQVGTVRIFMAPSLDEHQTRLTLVQQQRLFFEMDKFTVALKPGGNLFERSSLDSSITIPWEQSFEQWERATAVLSAQQIICGCGWPQHLLLPKGKADGQEFEVFVIITNWEQDRVRRKNPQAPKDDETQNCKQSVGFCGILDELFPDTKPMGFPFDRKPRLGPNGLPFEYFEDWIIPNSNMRTTQVKIVHRDVTVVAEGFPTNLPVIVQGSSKGNSKYDAGKKAGDVIPVPAGRVAQPYQPVQSDARFGVSNVGDWVDLGSRPYYNQSQGRRNPRESFGDPDSTGSYASGGGHEHHFNLY